MTARTKTGLMRLAGSAVLLLFLAVNLWQAASGLNLPGSAIVAVWIAAAWGFLAGGWLASR